MCKIPSLSCSLETNRLQVLPMLKGREYRMRGHQGWGIMGASFKSWPINSKQNVAKEIHKYPTREKPALLTEDQAQPKKSFKTSVFIVIVKKVNKQGLLYSIEAIFNTSDLEYISVNIFMCYKYII